jgi:hypothetical protein
MDQRTREEQTNALLSALKMADPRTAAAVDLVRQELVLLRDVAEAADSHWMAATAYPQGSAERAKKWDRVCYALDAWKGYR